MEYIICKTRTGTDTVPVYSHIDFPYYKINRRVLYAKNTKNRKHKYCEVIGTFDIETTTYNDGETYKGFMYLWSFTLDGTVCMGRTWEDLKTFLGKVSKTMNLSYDSKRLIIYIFNLPFEYQFMFRFFSTNSLFCTDKRKPVTWCFSNGFEARCAYKLTNKSLYRFTNDTPSCIHVKAKGDIDFKKFRTPFTEMTMEEKGYSVNDTLGLWEAIKGTLASDGDTLYSIPLTSTGYPRRDVKNAIKSSPNFSRYRERLSNMALDKYVYNLMLEASRGGDTHANRYKAGFVWHDVESYDAVSEYPYIMLTKKFPMSPFFPYGEVNDLDDLKQLRKDGMSFICRLSFDKIKAKKTTLIPCVPLSKCLRSPTNYRTDNGRILYAENVKITVTDIDYFRLIEEYNFTGMQISDLYISKYDYLPREIRQVIFEYFKRKTDIKCQRKKASTEELEYYYMKSKNLLNGIFGMMYSKPLHDEVLHIDGVWKKEEGKADLLKTQVKSLLFYPWGVWTTAHGRAHLQRLVKVAGGELIYCDTDSAKGEDFDTLSIEVENEKIRKECEEMGIVYRGEYLGIYERESKHESLPCYESFKTLGAKKYAYNTREKDGSLSFGCTISGVNKKTGALAMGDITNFREDFVINPSGGSILYYQDDDLHSLNFGDGEFQSGASIGLVDRQYKIGITEEQYFLYYLQGYEEEYIN